MIVQPENPQPDELPAELVAELRALGGVDAPAELAQRVEWVRQGRVQAPPELWQRVAAELRFGAPRRTRVFTWPRLAAAAGLLAVVGVAWLASPAGKHQRAEEFPVGKLAAATPLEVKQALRARLFVVEVAPERLSAATRAYAQLFQAPMKEDS